MDIIRKPNVGEYIRKPSFGLFPSKKPVIKVVSVKPTRNSRIFVINGSISLETDKTIILTEEQANEELDYFHSFKITPTNETIDINKAHFREDNSEPKIAYEDEALVLRKLYELKKEYPHKPFQAYVCHFCGKYHIGKNKTIVPAVEPPRKTSYLRSLIKRIIDYVSNNRTT